MSEKQALSASADSLFTRFWPALFALLTVGAIYAIISDQLSLGPRWLVLGVVVALLIPLSVGLALERFMLSRMITILILAVITLAEAASTLFLVASLAGVSVHTDTLPRATAITLLRDAALIWLVNVLTFALWYWAIDSGGPNRRHHHGYKSDDFVFPQLTLNRPDAPKWKPDFIDYLFLAFNTSTAFSPTDTLVLSRRAKILMMIQSAISLMVLAILAARAINTL